MDRYFLTVDTTVAEHRTHEFEVAMHNFLHAGGFSKRGVTSPIDLVLALKRTSLFKFHSYGLPLSAVATFKKSDNAAADPRLASVTKVRRYVHVWRVTTAADVPGLVGVMRACAEDPLYQAIDAAVLREVQDFTRQVNWNSGLVLPPIDARTRFVRTLRFFQTGGLPRPGSARQAPSEYDDPHKYLFDLRGLLPVAAKAGWHAVGQLQNVTGLLNTLVSFWQTDAPKSQVSPAERAQSIADDIRALSGRGATDTAAQNKARRIGMAAQQAKELMTFQSGGLWETFEVAKYFKARRVDCFDAC